MKAIIMAGGEGSRLRPITCTRPKPMVPVLGKPVMQYCIELLKKHGITDIGVTLQYLPDHIKDYFGDGSAFGVTLTYFIEETPLGTAGSVKNAQEFLDDTFAVISGDALTDINLTAALEYHRDKEAQATLVLSRVDVPLEYGVVVTDKQGNITRFLEKPGWSEVFSDTVNTGIYILEPQVLSHFETGEVFDFAKDLFPALLERHDTMVGYVADGYWCDIGDVSAYMACQYDILDKKVEVELDAQELSPGIWMGERVSISPSARLEAPVFLGADSVIADHANIEHYCIVDSGVHIGPQASLKRAMVHSGCHIGPLSELRGCVLCEKVALSASAAVFEQAVVGDGCRIGENAVIKPAIKVWPDKLIDDGTQIDSNMVWGSRHKKTLFGEKGITGEVNVDITPEFASRLGACFSSVCKAGRIAVSCSEDSGAAMLQSAVIAGLLSAGCEVYDFGTSLLPATRTAIRFYELDGGVHIGVDSQDSGGRAKIVFLDHSGADLNRAGERKMENLFEREDFIRSEGGQIRGVVCLQNYKHFYLRDLMGKLKHEHLGFRFLVNSTSRTAHTLLKQAAEELGCEVLITNLNLCSSREEGIRNLIKTVAEGNFVLGAALDEDCEKLILFDENGKVITDELYCVLTAYISLLERENATVVVPVSAPTVVEKLAQEYEGKVVRSKTAPCQMMKLMLENGADTQFVLNFDAIGAVVKMLDCLRETGKSLSKLAAPLGNVYLERREAACPPAAKGSVIRTIAEENSAETIDTTDGVKVFTDKGWVLVLPDESRPVCKVVAEGNDAEFASELADFYVEKIRQFSRE